MTKKELRRLSRGDLLEMLIDQSIELESVREKCAAAEAALAQRDLKLNNAGSIAEAALQLSGVFQAAEEASRMYLEEIQALTEESQRTSEQLLEETRRRCEELERETKIACAEMTAKAKAEAESILAAAQQNHTEKRV